MIVFNLQPKPANIKLCKMRMMETGPSSSISMTRDHVDEEVMAAMGLRVKITD